MVRTTIRPFPRARRRRRPIGGGRSAAASPSAPKPSVVRRPLLARRRPARPSRAARVASSKRARPPLLPRRDGAHVGRPLRTSTSAGRELRRSKAGQQADVRASDRSSDPARRLTVLLQQSVGSLHLVGLHWLMMSGQSGDGSQGGDSGRLKPAYRDVYLLRSALVARSFRSGTCRRSPPREGGRPTGRVGSAQPHRAGARPRTRSPGFLGGADREARRRRERESSSIRATAAGRQLPSARRRRIHDHQSSSPVK